MTSNDPSPHRQDAECPGPRDLLHHLETATAGPHDAEATAAAAWLAAEVIRYLNYTTGSDQGVEFASTLYTVAGAMSLAVGRIPQLAGQIRAWVERNAGRLVNDDSTPVSDTVAAVVVTTSRAADAATVLARNLGELQEALARTGTMATTQGEEARD